MSQQIQDPSWISIPFEKYSYNTSRIGARKYDWTHVGPRIDLNLVIRDLIVAEVGTRNIRTMMQVTAGSEILETQDLQELVELYRRCRTLPESDCPVRVVMRAPVWLAMVFPKTNTTVQRVQFKFNSESDFRKVVALFSELGLPNRDSPPSRTGTASKAPSCSSHAPSILSVTPVPTPFTAPSSVSRPSSSYQYPNLNDQVSNPLAMPHMNTPKLSEISVMAQQPAPGLRSYSAPYLPPHDMSTGTTSLEFAANSSFPHQFSSQNIAKYTSLNFSQMDPELNRCINYTTPHSQNSAAKAPDPTILYTQLHYRQGEALERSTNPRQGTSSPFFPARVDDLQQSQIPCKDFDSLDTRSQNIATLKTTTSGDVKFAAPQATTVDAVQNLWIPPKRELPFLKHQPAQRAPSSSVFDLPPLPKPESVATSGPVLQTSLPRVQDLSTPVARTIKRRVAERKAPASTDSNEMFRVENAPTNLIPEEVVLGAGPVRPIEDSSPLAIKSAATRRPASAASILQSKAKTAPRKRAAVTRPASVTKRLKMVDQGTQTLSISNSDGAATNDNKIGKVSILVPDDLSVISPPESYLNDIDDFISQHKNRPAPKELWDTPEYSSLDAEERKNVLNNFICDNLDDANFLQLCKDVEFSWRRIGLGL